MFKIVQHYLKKILFCLLIKKLYIIELKNNLNTFIESYNQNYLNKNY